MKSTAGIDRIAAALVVLILIHLLVFPQVIEKIPLPGGKTATDWPLVMVVFCANLFFLLSGSLQSGRRGFSWEIFLCTYLLLFVLIFVLAGRVLFFVLSIFMLSGLYHDKRKLGYLFLFLASVLLVSAYWIPAFILFSFLYYIVLETAGRVENTMEKIFLGIGILLLLLLLFPLINLLFQFQAQTLVASFSPALKEALFTSCLTSAVSTILILLFGIPLAYIMARKEFGCKPVIDALIDLPIMVPQTAAGIAILVLLGPNTPLGEFFSGCFGLSFAGSYLGIIACQMFVSSPFLLRSAIHAFSGVDRRLENVSRSLGAKPLATFLRVSLPLASAGIFNGCILCFSRAISEAGSLMIVAYRPATIPILIDDNFSRFGVREAAPLSVLFIIICLWGFIVLKWLYETRKKAVLLP
ncbi:MAG: ABC transporter permease [Candidatus Wallbacteria bacterium]|nr:ABC transporter permease [Candidatus Wallbacteria bacterium]